MVMAGFDKVDPAYPCLIGGCARVCARAGLHMTAGPVSNLIEKCRRELDEGFAVVEEYALHRRAGIAGRVRVPKP
jgi:hypothetical protein